MFPWRGLVRRAASPSSLLTLCVAALAWTCAAPEAAAQGASAAAPSASAPAGVATPSESIDRPPSPTSATGGEGGGFVEVRVGFYDTRDSGDGNPFLDETETVVEPAIVFQYNVTERLTVGGTASYDLVSAASIERLSNFGQRSGASSDNYVGGQLNLRYAVSDDLRLGVFGGGSQEYDYLSINGGVNASWDLAEKNTTLGLSLSSFVDQLKVIRFDGSDDEGTDDRITFTISPTIYQILSPRLHLQAGYSLTFQSGFLSTPYNAVVLEDPSDAPNPALENLARGVEVNEVLPDTRIRHALYGSLRYYFDTGTALEGRLRLYNDSWGITSFAPELRVYQRLADDQFLVRARYRYYSQSAADDFGDSFAVAPGDRAQFIANVDRTQDSDLGDFTSHTIGLKLTWNTFENHALSLSGDYVLRSDGLNQILFGVGWRWDF